MASASKMIEREESSSSSSEMEEAIEESEYDNLTRRNTRGIESLMTTF